MGFAVAQESTITIPVMRNYLAYIHIERDRTLIIKQVHTLPGLLRCGVLDKHVQVDWPDISASREVGDNIFKEAVTVSSAPWAEMELRKLHNNFNICGKEVGEMRLAKGSH